MKLKTKINDAIDAKNICGSESNNLKVISELYNNEIEIFGSDILTSLNDEASIANLEKLFSYLLEISHMEISITPRDIIYINSLLLDNKEDLVLQVYQNRRLVGNLINNKPVYPKTIRQIEYVKALDDSDLIFSIGPAGTGKTFLAVIHAVSMLKKGRFKKIILTRPAVEAGESLGFLPGDLKEKVDPYLRPLYDALYDSLGVEGTNQLIEKGVIEIAPLAYMRGRTLENAYIILDEAQNTTDKQMKMFLTRLGFNSKMVITGDISQIDLPKGIKSGLMVATRILRDIKEIKIIEFERIDIVRHPIVLKIIQRYDEYEAQ